MEDLIEGLMRDNVAEVKVVLASVALALAVYQLVLIAVGYAKLQVPFLSARAASTAHRTIGDTIALLLVVVGVTCLSVYGFEDDYAAHTIAGSALLAVLTLKVAVVRRGLGLGRALPLLGITVFTLLAVTWATSAGAFLGGLVTGARQVIGSLLVGVAIVAITIALVTAKLGPGGGRDDDDDRGGDRTEQSDDSGRGRGRSGEGGED